MFAAGTGDPVMNSRTFGPGYSLSCTFCTDRIHSKEVTEPVRLN